MIKIMILILLFAKRCIYSIFRMGPRKETVSKRLRAEPSGFSPPQRQRAKKVGK